MRVRYREKKPEKPRIYYINCSANRPCGESIIHFPHHQLNRPIYLILSRVKEDKRTIKLECVCQDKEKAERICDALNFKESYDKAPVLGFRQSAPKD